MGCRKKPNGAQKTIIGKGDGWLGTGGQAPRDLLRRGMDPGDGHKRGGRHLGRFFHRNAGMRVFKGERGETADHFYGLPHWLPRRQVTPAVAGGLGGTFQKKREQWRDSKKQIGPFLFLGGKNGGVRQPQDGPKRGFAGKKKGGCQICNGGAVGARGHSPSVVWRTAPGCHAARSKGEKRIITFY